LSVYWNGNRKDMLTVASDDGIRYAKKYSYTLVNSTVGYVYKEDETKNYIMGSDNIPIGRWEYARQLMLSAVL